MTQQEIIMNLTEKYLPHIINLRRTIHKHPELSNEEQDTAALLAGELKALGFDVRENIAGGYGVSALLKGNHPGPTVALRTDMDALAVQEDTGLSLLRKQRVRCTPAAMMLTWPSLSVRLPFWPI